MSAWRAVLIVALAAVAPGAAQRLVAGEPEAPRTAAGSKPDSPHPALPSQRDLKAAARAIAAIAADIEAMRPGYPQLSEFVAERNTEPARMTISYGAHTHAPRPSGGWTAGVPEPDEDGVWFSIDLHDPRSTLELHTQPMVGERHCFRGLELSFLLREGRATRSLNAPLWGILKKHGVRACSRS